jgi:hypothetical protein
VTSGELVICDWKNRNYQLQITNYRPCQIPGRDSSLHSERQRRKQIPRQARNDICGATEKLCCGAGGLSGEQRNSLRQAVDEILLDHRERIGAIDFSGENQQVAFPGGADLFDAG